MVTTVPELSDLQHHLSKHYSSITYDFPINSIYSKNITDSVLRVLCGQSLKNQNHMKIAEQILQGIVADQELGICEPEN